MLFQDLCSTGKITVLQLCFKTVDPVPFFGGVRGGCKVLWCQGCTGRQVGSCMLVFFYYACSVKWEYLVTSCVQFEQDRFTTCFKNMWNNPFWVSEEQKENKTDSTQYSYAFGAAKPVTKL